MFVASYWQNDVFWPEGGLILWVRSQFSSFLYNEFFLIGELNI